MSTTPLEQVLPVLELAIGPAILVSGVGLLLLTMTNRLGRAIDRSRQLFRELAECSGEKRSRILDQVRILFRRARLLRLAITLAAVSASLAGLLVIALFVSSLLHLELGLALSALFVACMAALLASLGAFIRDIHLSLIALDIELGQAVDSRG